MVLFELPHFLEEQRLPSLAGGVLQEQVAEEELPQEHCAEEAESLAISALESGRVKGYFVPC